MAKAGYGVGQKGLVRVESPTSPKSHPAPGAGRGFEAGRGRDPLPQSAIGEFSSLVDSKGDSRFVRTISGLFSRTSLAGIGLARIRNSE
jgi:hypothetical protein